jgi:hypothetical protein
MIRPKGSFVLKPGDLEWQLGSLVFLSHNDRNDQPRSPPPDLRTIIREGELELSDECDHERVHLDNAAGVTKAVERQRSPQGMNS